MTSLVCYRSVLYRKILFLTIYNEMFNLTVVEEVIIQFNYTFIIIIGHIMIKVIRYNCRTFFKYNKHCMNVDFLLNLKKIHKKYHRKLHI